MITQAGGGGNSERDAQLPTTSRPWMATGGPRLVSTAGFRSKMPGPFPLPISNQSREAMSKKLHIKPGVCQMNEYDSSKMAGPVGCQQWLHAYRGARRGRCPGAQHLFHPREGPGEGVPPARSLEEAQGKKPGLVIGVGGCVASQEGENLRSRAPLCGHRLRTPDPAPPARP